MQYRLTIFNRRGFIAAMAVVAASIAFTDRISATHEAGHVCIDVVKFSDKNTNGVQDAGESGIAGWRIELWKNGSLLAVKYTDATGSIHFHVPKNSGKYTVKEVPPSPFYPAGPWQFTRPPAVEVDVCETDFDVCFGNVCVGGGGGHTPGFWSNKNGQKAMEAMPGGMAGTLAFLRNLNLRDASGNHFDPTTYAQFRTWLLGGKATNMAYMLSVQFAAMQLNVRAGFVSPSAGVIAPGTQSETSYGFATIQALLNETNTELGTTGYTPAGHPRRAYQEALKNALDKANNNTNFVSSASCKFTSPY